MFSFKALLSLIFITLSVVDASPLSRRSGKATLGIATKINAQGVQNIADKDRARAQTLKQAGRLGRLCDSIGLADATVAYTAEVGIGNPPTNYSLVVDTGKANTWVGANRLYVPTTTSQDTGNTFSVTYGAGSVSGEEWIDQVTLSSDSVIYQQSIGVASESEGFGDFDGVLGVGPVDLTEGTVSNTYTVPTISDNLLSQGTISEEVLGVYFVPAIGAGELTFGEYDSSVITDSVHYAPLTTTSPASAHWGIDQSITYGQTTILSSTAGIVDTATTLILIASDAFDKYKSATGAKVASNGLLSITYQQYANLQTLSFNIGGTSYDLTPNAQIWPRALNSEVGGDSDSIFLIVNDIGTHSGSGLDFVDGYTFLERYYSVFDTTNGRIGFARTAHTYANSN